MPRCGKRSNPSWFTLRSSMTILISPNAATQDFASPVTSPVGKGRQRTRSNVERLLPYSENISQAKSSTCVTFAGRAGALILHRENCFFVTDGVDHLPILSFEKWTSI